VKPGHRSRRVRRGPGDAPNVGDHGVTSCLERAPVGAFGDTSGACDPHSLPLNPQFGSVDFNWPVLSASPSPRTQPRPDAKRNVQFAAFLPSSIRRIGRFGLVRIPLPERSRCLRGHEGSRRTTPIRPRQPAGVEARPRRSGRGWRASTSLRSRLESASPGSGKTPTRSGRQRSRRG
jgi:hypothetical protein